MSLSLNQLTTSQLAQLHAKACYRESRLRKETTFEAYLAKYKDDPVGFITRVLKQAREDSWRPWRVVLKAAYGQPLNPDELILFREMASREPPKKRVKELWLIVGRRGGKDSIASMIAVEAAQYADTTNLRPGEEAIVACIACTRDQAEIVWKYTRGYFEQIPLLRSRLASPKMTAGKILLKNKVEIRVATNNYRAPRGRGVVCAILDECFVAGTLVETDAGSRAIETIVVGDRVWTRQGLRKVLKAKETGQRSLWEVSFNNGQKLTGTANHPIFVVGQGFVALSCLWKGDEVIEWSSLLSGTIDDGISQKMDTIKTETANFSIAKFICLFTDLYHQKFKYIIKTKIKQILQLVTWKPLAFQTISNNTNLEDGLILPPSNIKNACSKCGQIVSLLNGFVYTAAQSFIQSRLEENFVLAKIVVTDFIKKQILMDVRKDRELRQCEPTTKKRTLVKSVSQLTIKAPVYNLEVEDCPEYFANGVLVHNCAFYRDEDSATPDVETYNALLPGMGMYPEAMLIGISSPHKQSGLLFQKFEDHYGRDNDDILVIQAPTRLMNPVIDQINPGLIDKAVEEDPERAAAEYFAQFRRDLADYVSREVVMAAVQSGKYENPPDQLKRTSYTAFCDPSGGSRDSFTLAVSHFDIRADTAILDCIREHRSPFSPENVVDEFAHVIKSYGLSKVTGDRYAGEWPVEQFAKRGVVYEASEESKSDIYRDFLPLLNSRRVRLLDNQRLISQLCNLERRTIRGGRDSIDHPTGAYDDVVNAAAGALVLVAGDERSVVVRRYLGVG